MTNIIIFVVGAWSGLVIAALLNIAREEKKGKK